MKEMSKLIPALEDKLKSLESNILNDKTTLRILRKHGVHLKDSVRDAWKENAQLQENCKQLSQEPQVWKERVSELTKQKTAVYTHLGEVDTIKEDFTEHIKNLQTRQATLQAEKTWFEIENQKLQQNLKTTTELHEEKRMIYCMKFMAEDHYRLETEETFPSTRKDQPCSRRAGDL
jgi:chromosome segregation ATPase